MIARRSDSGGRLRPALPMILRRRTDFLYLRNGERECDICYNLGDTPTFKLTVKTLDTQRETIADDYSDRYCDPEIARMD
jgi:hypothetical protein